MHFSVVVSLFALLMTASLGVLGNLANSQASDVANIGLYRRETKILHMDLVSSEFVEAYGDDDGNKPLPLCFNGTYKEGPKVTEFFLKKLETAEGGRLHGNRWVQKVSGPTEGLEYGCYMYTDNPRTIKGVRLNAFTSVITTIFEKGTKLFIAKLKDVVVDNGVRHNGCVEVVDNSAKKDVLKLYVFGPGRKQRLPSSKHGWINFEVEVRESCEIKKYELEHS
ncbi:hypothetical protein IWQ62_001128 [Dispira parvispora]|uniref:Uncharacterized protein n=1 Tax=Dispira parvispora TaxID=1520584 RepID=A0A9W8AYM3_9FUNG|nr:hypothetical protein IWQ62_001128 [Dispira parvispora]